jgi:hypothetical protein
MVCCTDFYRDLPPWNVEMDELASKEDANRCPYQYATADGVSLEMSTVISYLLWILAMLEILAMLISRSAG